VRQHGSGRWSSPGLKRGIEGGIGVICWGGGVGGGFGGGVWKRRGGGFGGYEGDCLSLSS